MRATPRRIFVYLNFVFRRKQFQKLSVIGELRPPLVLDMIQRVGQGHFAKTVMMPIGLAVGGDMRNLGRVVI